MWETLTSDERLPTSRGERKKEASEGFVNQEFRKNRGYDDYLKYMEKHPDTPVIQMDTVKGCREQGKRLLTIHFCNTNMILMLLMRDGKADTVVEQFDMLTGLLGLEEFRRIFTVILTDNGSEFKHTRELETTEAGKKGFNRCPAGLFLLWITFSTASNFALSVSTRAVS